MSRGVAVIKYAEDILYFSFDGNVYGEYNPETDEYEGDEYNQFESEDNWESFKTELTDILIGLFPSLERPCRPKWDGECHIILENRLALFALAEYCGCVSLSIAARGDSDYYYSDSIPLAKRWIASIFNKLRKNLNHLPYAVRIVKICTASNGESFFEKAVQMEDKKTMRTKELDLTVRKFFSRLINGKMPKRKELCTKL